MQTAVRPDDPVLGLVGRVLVHGQRHLARDAVPILWIQHGEEVCVLPRKIPRFEAEQRMNVIIPDDRVLCEIPVPRADRGRLQSQVHSLPIGEELRSPFGHALLQSQVQLLKFGEPFCILQRRSGLSCDEVGQA